MKRIQHIIPFVLIPLFLASCTKPADPSGEESFDPHPTWTDSDPDAFWEKQPDDGFQVDTAWEGDTIIYF